MEPWFWISLLIFHLLTLGWYGLIRKDALGYMKTKIKVLGPENEAKINTPKFKVILNTYLLVLLLSMGAITFYFLTYE